MPEMVERHEIRIRGKDHTITFIADSQDGRLVIRQEPDQRKFKDVCAITLSDPDELRAFFKGLRRILSSLGHAIDSGEAPAGTRQKPRAVSASREEERQAVIAQARQKNPLAFATWSKEEEQEVRRRYQAGENIQAITRAHSRSPRVIELRLQRLGVMPPKE